MDIRGIYWLKAKWDEIFFGRIKTKNNEYKRYFWAKQNWKN